MHELGIVQFQKISILPPQKVLEFLGRGGGGEGLSKNKKLKKCMKFKCKFSSGGGMKCYYKLTTNTLNCGYR